VSGNANQLRLSFYNTDKELIDSMTVEIETAVLVC